MVKKAFQVKIKVGNKNVTGKQAQKNLIPILTRLERLVGLGTLNKRIIEFFDFESLKAAGFIAKNYLSGQLLKRRTASLARSVTGMSLLVGGLPAMKVGIFRGPALKYASIQEHGGVITPVRAKALAIPQEAALTPAGVDRFGGPRGYPGELKFIPFRNSGVAVGGLFKANSVESSKGFDLNSAIMVYMLVKQVTIKATHWLSRGFADYLPLLASNLGEYLRDLLVGAKR